MQYRATVYAQGQSWPFASDPNIAGCLAHESASNVLLRWVCVQLATPADDGPLVTNESKLGGIHFHHSSCLRSPATLLCENCNSNVHMLVDLCRKPAQT